MKLALLALMWGVFILAIIAVAGVTVYAIAHGHYGKAVGMVATLVPLGGIAWSIDRIEAEWYD